MEAASTDTQVLLDRAQQGDASAAQRLLTLYRNDLKRMISVRMDARLTGRIDPSDVLQEASLEAARRLPEYLERRDCAFYPWLRQIAWEKLVHAHRQHLQAQRRSVRREAAPPMELSEESVMQLAALIPGGQSTPSHQAIRRELRDRVPHCAGAVGSARPRSAGPAPPRTVDFEGHCGCTGSLPGGSSVALPTGAGTAARLPRRGGKRMNAPGPLTQTSTSEDRAFDALVFRVSADIEAGHSVDLTALAAEHPQHIGRLRKLLPTLQAMADLGHSGPRPRDQGPAPRKTSTPPHGALGDFRILREVGRGGMGVVYEAEQLSLHRRVALKVLPFAAVLDPRHLQRFKNEVAGGGAQLEHPHIVDVYGVGCERGVHHYAMRFIDGQTLADVIAQLRERREAPTGRPSRQAPADPFAQTAVAYAVSTSTQAPRKVSFVSFPADGTAISREFFRSVALLGRDVANALDYAHERGVVHRDIKPGNIMLDGAGKAWVTDFGLAHIESDVSLTMSGDVLGTLRYMSPEQALGKRGAIDHRTDVYSLAITLYELLTLQPAYPQTDRQQLLQRIATEDPTPPRQLRPQIPADLETIVLKATAKNPQERYETAGDLADDLQRFLDYQPIKARRPDIEPADEQVGPAAYGPDLVGRGHSAGEHRRAGGFDAADCPGAVTDRDSTHAGPGQLHRGPAAEQSQRQKTEAERHALKARRTAYVADMRLAFQQWNRDYLAEVQSLLDDQIPQPGEADLRGLEWYALRTQIGRRFHTLGRHDAPVHDIDLFPDGHTFATAGEDGYVRVWDADSRSLLREFHLQDKPVYTVGVSPDGKWLAYGAGRRDELDVPKPATIIDAQTGTVLGTTNWHKNTIRQVRFSPDGRYLASGSLQDKVSVWEFTDGVHGRSRDLTGEQDIPSEYFTLLFLDSRRLLTEYHNRTGYRVWDLETGEPLQDYPDLNEVNVHAVAWHPRHHVFAYVPSKDYGQTIQFRDGTTGRELGEYSLNEEVTALTFSPYTDSLSAGTARGCLRIMDLAFPPRSPGSDEPVQVKSTTLWQIHEGEIKRVRYLDRYRIITAGVDGRVVMRYAPPVLVTPARLSRAKGPSSRLLRVKALSPGRVWTARSVSRITRLGSCSPPRTPFRVDHRLWRGRPTDRIWRPSAPAGSSAAGVSRGPRSSNACATPSPTCRMAGRGSHSAGTGRGCISVGTAGPTASTSGMSPPV